MLHKKALWRGLLFVFAIVLSISIIASLLLESLRANLDNMTGSRSELIVSEDDGTLWSAFTPPDDVLNADGTGNSQKLIKKLIQFGRDQAVGGAVLLKNNNNALPLASGSSVTMLGIRSHVPILGAGMGMPIRGAVITMEDALGDTKTHFNETSRGVGYTSNTYSTVDDYNFTDVGGSGAGYKLNPDMIAIYDKLNETAGLTYLGPWNSRAMATFDPKEPSLADLESVNASYKNSFATYGDAAIVVVGRPSGEGGDYQVGGIVAGLGATEPLELTTNERDMIQLATDNFDRVIVVVETTSPMEIEELKNNDKIDAILWIGHVGNFGMLGISDILTGKASPSGAMTDVYAVKNLSAPAMQNFGSYTYANVSDITRSRSTYYVIEPESIYVGYRYYETRYNDIIEGRGNADSTTGAVASTGNWRYNEEVAYTFGYGLSYTTFNQELVGKPTITQDAHTFKMTFEVKVTNTGSQYSGKSIVQIYGQAPYKEGGVEKSAIQLLAYDKTAELAPGESQTLTILVDLQNIASYDSTHDNGDGTKGTYILDEGNYYFALGNGTHEALNNVLAKQGKTPQNTSNKMDAEGDASKVYEYYYDYAGGDVDDNTFAVTKNNVQVSNQLEYADWNYFKKEVTYLSRSNWSGTYPVEYANMSAPSNMIPLLNGKYYEIKTDQDTSDIVWGSTATSHKFYDMAFADFDDYRWDEILGQLSLEEAMGIIACGGNSFRAIESVGFLEASTYTENSGNGVDLQIFQCNTPDAPWAIPTDDTNADFELEAFGCGPLVASSFDPALVRELGEIVGLEALFVGLPVLWGPGLNTHRMAYNGRNGDYYSEDPILCGNVAMEFALGALEYGLIASPKHFAFNDQETNRNGIAPFMTEQRAREIELRAFQIAFEADKYDTEEENVGMLGLMCSFSKIGPVECTSSRGLMTNILQEEWGFHGYAVTDISDDFDLFTAVAYSGTTGYDVRARYTSSGFERYESMADGIIPSPELYAGDRDIQLAIKNAAHNVLWVFAQSNLMNSYNSSTRSVWQMTWYRALYISLITISAICTVATAALYVVSEAKSRKEVA